MTTPILMLVLLMAPSLGARLFSLIKGRTNNQEESAATFGLAILFIFTGVGHFVQTETMAQMLPPWVPARVPLVYLTGILEFALALGFFIPRTRKITGWTAVAMLLLFFPVNIYAAVNRVPMGGHGWGPVYLLLRLPVQAIILFWIYWFVLRTKKIVR